MTVTGWRVRAMIVVLWPAGLRIQDALALGEHDLDQGIDPEKITTAVRTRRPPLPGPLPATGAEMRESAVVIYRIADDRIAEHSFDQG
jgi:hypothetical protein